MKQHRRSPPLVALLLLALAILVWKCPRSAKLAAVEVESAPSAIPAPAQEPESIVENKPANAQPSAEERRDEAETSEASALESLIESVDPLRADSMAKAVQSLSHYPAEQVSAFLLESLKQAGTTHLFERDRLIMVANSLQSKAALPFWENLVRRQTPRYAAEETLRNPKHPTLESRYIDMEQLQAIRNIGLLAHEDRAARRVLMDIILNPDPTAHRTLHREQAYVALKEADLSASLRVLKQLAATDDLLKRL